MGSVHSCVLAAAAAACSACFLYVCGARGGPGPRRLHHDHLPGLAHLYLRYLGGAAARRRGRLHPGRDVCYTVFGCRVDPRLLRRFCGAAGYGWDYPDSQFRDVPPCFPEALCSRLLLMVVTDGGFRLSPAGLSRLRQTLRTLEPVDELKKGPFSLRARVLGYRETGSGPEADIRLSAVSRTGSLVWESVLTLGSGTGPQEGGGTVTSPPDPVAVRRVQLEVPRTADLPDLWLRPPLLLPLLALPARLLGLAPPPGLWVLSACLAEIEKHKGAEAVAAPANVSVLFRPPPAPPSRATLELWEADGGVGFRVGSPPLAEGVVWRAANAGVLPERP